MVRRYIYRHQAGNPVCYDEESKQPTQNPFKKLCMCPQHGQSYPLQPRRETGLENASILPPGTANSDQFIVSSVGDISPEPYNTSQPPINFSSEPDLENGTRRRKGFLDKSKRHGSTTEDPENNENDYNEPKFTVASQLRAILFNSWINVLLIATPVGIVVYAVDANPIAVFVVNFVAIIPLAAMLNFATEEIALRAGETVGGLLNASFGNAVELIVGIIALVKKEVIIVQTSLIGSMLSNLLLVLGMCFFFGGMNRLEQHFNVTVAQTAASLLALAVSSLVIPTAFRSWSDGNKEKIAPISRGTSILLLITYGCYLFFQLKSHVEMFNRPSLKVKKRRQHVTEGDTNRNIAQIARMAAGTTGGVHSQQIETCDPDDEPEKPQLMIWVAFLTLGVATIPVAVCAEFMVDSISALTATGNISETFVGLILLPIVGNAAEHATAVTVACKDKMDLAIGVAVGSSMQIALFVLPLTIVIGWIMGVDNMTLSFDAFQVILLFVAVLLVNYLISDGKSHWLEGVLLMMMYLIIALAAWFF